MKKFSFFSFRQKMIFGTDRLCRPRNFILFLLLMCAFTFAFVSYYCENDTDGWACPFIGMGTHSRSSSSSSYDTTKLFTDINRDVKSNIKAPSLDSIPSRALNSAHGYSEDVATPTSEIITRKFNPNGDDVLVFLHIQKTGGTTFGRHLVRNMRMDPPCMCFKGRKKCKCVTNDRHVWLFSRFSTGWSCGLHADWTELKECVDHRLDRIEGEKRPRRYFYITILREPVRRYLSEWRHVSRGATWKNAALRCNGQRATLAEVPRCFPGEDWTGVSVDQFMTCPHNLANNRQTRMTANLSLIGCYNKSFMNEAQRQATMLKSAMDNLASMAFVGFTEHQLYTQYLFERTFGLKFSEDFIQINVSYTDGITLSPEQRRKVEELNSLDVKLYEFGKRLFMDRLRQYLLNDSRAVEQMRQAGLSSPARQTTDTILRAVRIDQLTSGKPPDPNSYWVRRMMRKKGGKVSLNGTKNRKRRRKKKKEDFWMENDIVNP